jgi:hypothetical protein
MGEPFPETSTTLPGSARKDLDKLLRDRRMIAYAVKLLVDAETEE